MTLLERLEAPAYWMSGSGAGHEGENDAPREAATRIRQLEAENAALREALTPSGDTKAAYAGEFHMGITLRLRREEEYRRVQIPWDTIKEMMAAIRARALLADGASEGRR